MYERFNKYKNKINSNKRFSFFNYTNGKKHLNTLTEKKIQFNYFSYNNISNKKNFNYPKNNISKSKLDFLFTKIKNKNIYKNNINNQNDIYLKTYSNFRVKNKINNNKINNMINNIHKEIISDKKNFNFNFNFFENKIFDYKTKNKLKTMNFEDKRNKSFEYKKNIIKNNSNDYYLKTLNNYDKNNNISNNILFKRNKTNNYFNNFNTINLTNPFKNRNNNNNFIINQNNTNNYFILNYNNKKKDNRDFSFFNKKDIHNNIFNNIKKQKEKEGEENSIDFNNIDDSTILNKFI